MKTNALLVNAQYVCSPLALNSAAVASPAANDGPGACTLRRCSSCGNALTTDRSYCALSFCLAYDAAAHASDNKNPLGHINRDKTGLKTVRKGVFVVRYPGASPLIVVRVRKGFAYCYNQFVRNTPYFNCSTLTVV